MADEKGLQKGPQKEGKGQLDGLSTEQKGEMLGVLQEKKHGEINPELYGNEKDILKDLRENHVKAEEVQLFGHPCEIIHIDLPHVGDFQGLKMDILSINDGGVKFLIKNGKLDNYKASDDLSNFLGGVSGYMKSYGIKVEGNAKIENSDNSNKQQHNDILKYYIRILGCYTLLDGGKVLTIENGKGDYCIEGFNTIKEFYGPLSLLLSDSSIKENIVYPIPGSCYEPIDLQNWKGESKADEIMKNMDELKKADLVLVYRGNEKYSAMSCKLEQLVKFKYGGKIYSIVIPQGTEKSNLSEQDMKVLTDVLTNCKCMTDGTVSEWTGIETKKIENILEDKELTDKQNQFLDIAGNIEKYYMDEGVDTVYILSSQKNPESEGGGVKKLLLEHGGFCQKEDGTIYYIKTPHDQDEGHYNDAKRFWKNLFSHMNVEFIEDNKLLCIGYKRNVNGGVSTKYKFDYGKVKGALSIVDRHFGSACDDFENEGGKVITFGGDEFGSGMSAGNVGELLAEKICERK